MCNYSEQDRELALNSLKEKGDKNAAYYIKHKKYDLSNWHQ